MAKNPKVYWRLYPGGEWEPTRRRRGLMVCEELRRLDWEVDHDENSNAALVVLQRIFNPPLIRKQQARGAVVIAETNDCNMLKGTRFFVPTEEESIRLADYVVVTCGYMQKRYARVNANCLIAPEALEPEFWTMPVATLPKKPLVLSWHGMPDNLQYFEPIIESLGSIKDLRLRIVMPEWDSRKKSNRERVGAWPVPADFVVWERETFVKEIAKAHAGIVVLPDTEFCRNKAHHKCAGYLALGIPVIASNMPGYREVIRHGESGLLAETPEDFRECIEQLRDPALRERMGKAGREFSKHFRQAAVGKLWDGLLQGAWEHRGETPT